MGNDNSLLIVVLAVIAYFVLTAEKARKSALGASLFGAEAATPAGTITSTGAAGAVTEIAKGSCLGYIFNPAMFAACIAEKTTTLIQSPQTPAPTAARCIYNSSYLAGDRRCVPDAAHSITTDAYGNWYNPAEGGYGRYAEESGDWIPRGY